jgi:predicted carbohydrate-binding protein with CBM5 and CBM33 domain
MSGYFKRILLYQFDDYSKYVAHGLPSKEAKRRAEVFLQDCEKAFEMDARFVKRQRAIK